MPKSWYVLGACALAACTQPSVPSSPAPTRAPAPLRSAPPPAAPAPVPVIGATAKATLHDLAGARVGTATLTETRSGLLVSATVWGLGLGAHGIHLHSVGRCVAPFTSAGDHFNPTGKHHGFENADGPHLGDLPNVFTPPAGKFSFELVVPNVTLRGANALLDADGASIVIHTAKDDYATDPAGNSGGRIACGVIVETPMR